MPVLWRDPDLTARVVLEALLNAVWQGVALTAAIALLLRVLPATSAATRHAVWWAALMAVVLLPLVPPSYGEFWQSFSRPIDWQAQPGGAELVGDVPNQATAWASRITWSPARPWPATILALLTVLVAVRLVRLGFSIRTLRRWKRQAVPLPAPIGAALDTVLGRHAVRGVRICQSHTIDGPVTVGFRRPMILLPGHLLSQLSGDETAQVVLHELAHVRRRDDWTHLAQKLLQAIFFFHPAVRWIRVRLELEREMACDAEVVARLARPRSYARCLTRLAQLAVTSRRALAPGAVPPHNQLTRRVGALIAPDGAVRTSLSHASLAAAVGLLLCGAAALRSSPAPVRLFRRGGLFAKGGSMRSTRKLLGLGMVVGTLTFAGCAPVASTWNAGPGIQLGITPSGRASLANPQCSMMASPGVGSPLSRNASAASTVMARMQQVARIQWSFLLANIPMPSRMETWKSIADGDC